MVPWDTQFHNTNGTWIGSAVFAGLTTVTDRPTDHATPSVTRGRIYKHSMARRPNNVNEVHNKYHEMLRSTNLGDLQLG